MAADAAPMVNPNYAAVAVMCDALGTDPHVLDTKALAKQCSKAKDVLAAGHTFDDIRDYTAFLLSQNWRDEPIDMFTIAKGIATWKLNGRALKAKSRASPTNRRRNEPDNSGLEAVMRRLP